MLASETCGCFYCLKAFPPSAIAEWVDRGETALCPRCGIDAVLGSASGYPLTREFLREMRSFWF
ncbi:MAG TPA: cytoplasmic protein [Longimicrobiaceae bacterium]|nr:cytoplasmic protein [Longimicrobiaceae bacterium]